MSSFDRASTGLAGLDAILDGLRWGDNVVWQVEDIADYRHMARALVKQARRQRCRVVYLRFGQHPPILDPGPDIIEYQLDAALGFESFSSQIHAIATQEGKRVCYLFDSLSDLLSAWATDLMIGNFFRVTCPYLFRLDTIAYFALIRNRNSYATIARIRETTQLLLDLFSIEGEIYVHPLKVWNRYSPTLFLPHARQGDSFVPITSSTQTAQIFSRFQNRGPGSVQRKIDYWDRVFLDAEELLAHKRQGKNDTAEQEMVMADQLTRMVLGREERILEMARRYLTLEDLVEMRNRLVGSGFIGGKSVGLILARKILESDPARDWCRHLEPHDSFYIGSDVFYTYLVENQCWELRQQQKVEENYFRLAPLLRERIQEGIMPAVIKEQLGQMLDYFGQAPVIVRSSSLLEDGFGNAFAGKYESVFCVNQGDSCQRYTNFEQAVKTIYASTMNEDALAYRLQRGMADSDEQMALLVQRVSGSMHSAYFFPHLAGVAMSHNPYAWHEDMDPEAGMLRLVVGLGTRAVDRVDDDYPRIVALDKPTLQPLSDPEELGRCSQHKLDVLDLVHNEWAAVNLSAVTGQLSARSWWREVAAPDYQVINRCREMGLPVPNAWILSFPELLQGEFPALMRELLRTLATAYAYPVDTEFTANFDDMGQLRINLLQCRPLQTSPAGRADRLNLEYDPDRLLFATRRHTMGGSISLPLARVIYVEPEAYNALPVNDRYQVARLVGRLNRIFVDREEYPYMLIGPGRWGSSTPSLGIPVSFAEICNARVLVEVAREEGGFTPELSFGTHFFQDLVETRIFYVALFPGKAEAVFDPARLDPLPGRLEDYLPGYDKWGTVVKVYDLVRAGTRLWLQSDMDSHRTVCFFANLTSGDPVPDPSRV